MFTVGKVLATTFRIWSRGLPGFFLIAVICYLPVIGFYVLLQIDAIRDLVQRYYFRPVWETHPALENLTGGRWIAYAFVYGAIANYVVARLRGERIGIFRGLGRALRRSGPLLGAELVTHLAMMGTMTFVMASIWSREDWLWRGTGVWGWILWIAVGAGLGSLFFTVAPVAVTERRGPLSTIARTFALARGERFKLFAIALVLVVLGAGVNYVVMQLMLDNLDAYRANIQLYAYLRLALELVMSALAATAFAVAYEQLREAKEGPTPDALDRVFG